MHNIRFWTEVIRQLSKRRASNAAGGETRKYLKYHSVIQRPLYLGQGRGVSRVCPRNTVREVGIHPGQDTGPLQGTMNTLFHTFIHTSGQFILANPPPGMF